MNIWVTSDTHWSHKFIISACNRPFSSVEEMDETLIKNWNERVKPEDTIYHLGDFAYRCKNPYAIFSRLNGKKHLIKGNHDKKDVLKFPWESIHDIYDLYIDKQLIVLCHYSFRVWKNSSHGSWLLFGHSHGKLPPLGFSFDVGVDAWSYKPISIYDEVKQKMATLSVENHPEAELILRNQNNININK